MPYKDKKKLREYQRRWVKARREEWLAANGPCKKCGSTIDLEVDHVDPEQKTSHRIWSWSKERREAELAKCQVLCASCHLEKSIAYLEKDHGHGHATTYQKGCRCDLCKKAKTIEVNEWRWRTGRRKKRSYSSDIIL